MRSRLRRLEQATREERHMEDSKAEFMASIQELRRLAETGEPSEKYRIVDKSGNEVAGQIPDLSE